jgi:hypothetical protein
MCNEIQTAEIRFKDFFFEKDPAAEATDSPQP